MLTPFKGHLDNFIEFIEEKWGWKVSYEDSNKQVLIVDEDKPFCVCPLLQKEKEKKFPALCYCSEGFAGKNVHYRMQPSCKCNCHFFYPAGK